MHTSIHHHPCQCQRQHVCFVRTGIIRVALTPCGLACTCSPARSFRRVLQAFHLGLEKPTWLSEEYYLDTVLTMDVSAERQAAYDAQKVE